MISAADVKELRSRTGAGMMDCKRALEETGGDMDKAIEYLRMKGLAAAAKKAGRATSEGIVDAYIHGGGRIGVLIEVNCETDFVARTDEFKQLVHDLAMQVAAARPQYVRREDVPQEVIEKEKSILRAQALNEGRPEKVLDKIVEGRLEKFYQEACLMEQPFIKDMERTVKDLIAEKIAKLGENIEVRRFVRFELGEGGIEG
ncbi:MAG: translation elongation factor Ts [Thermoanaerobacteraceae bacterium]|uniref:translation elongation factor Ts n=1 Tax=Thermanaeromonas sp. C210 TaxID=2731925 RepID=UPI00155D3FAC|nr:translation elongation factor Ts [Thermanaeromonas sp. C210]MBE3581575.1 translation elongation factor Ts [Thermoanaerobacteraceae bacterium]GFN23859.1 elongation factor Ts [Thermanaeromonas sp. C210]